MSLRLPSFGLLYLLAMSSTAAWALHAITRPMFFEYPDGSAERDLGEVRYLLRIASAASESQRREWIPHALSLSARHADAALTSRVLRALNKPAIPTDAVNVSEIHPGILWAFGIGEDGWTDGIDSATFWIRNPDSVPRRFGFVFGDGGYEDERDFATCTVDGVETRIEFGGSSGMEKLARFMTPPVAGNGELFFHVRMSPSVTREGRRLGVRFLGIESIQ